tara:strand:+ start:6122 stop:6316 length:195 start_codon:yes stop_codon:yes gene_type:complete
MPNGVPWETPITQHLTGRKEMELFYFNAITCREIECHYLDNKHLPIDPYKPDIFRLEYIWDEIR